MPRLGEGRRPAGPGRLLGRRAGGQLALLAAALAAVACAQFSPQTSELRPQWGFTPHAASASQGLYAQQCGPTLSETQRQEAGCPQFYGLLPVTIDRTDELRLRILRAEMNDSGAPWLVTAAAYPVGAYALYRGLFGQGEAVRKEVARLGLIGSAAYGWLKSRESPPRQQIRLAAVDALSCAMYGSAARYLYEVKDIDGEQGGAGRLSPPPVQTITEVLASAPADAASATAPQLTVRTWVNHRNEAATDARRQGLEPSRAALDDKRLELTQHLIDLRAALAATPASFTRAGAYRNGCDGNARSTTCQARGETGVPVVTEPNPEHVRASDTLDEAGRQLEKAGKTEAAAKALLDRIKYAWIALQHTTATIASAADKAELATEADVETLRRSVAGMKLGSQDLSGLLSKVATPPPAASAPPGTPAGQNDFARRNSVPGAAAGRSVGAAGRDKANEALLGAHAQARRAMFELIALESRVQAYLEVDRQRAAQLQGREDCQFVPPGLKLVVDPQEPTLTMAPGGTQRLVAQGGTQLPTVSLVGGASAKNPPTLRTEPDTSTGRQSLTVVISAPASAPEQDLSLVFRNGELIQHRTVSVRKPAGGRP